MAALGGACRAIVGASLFGFLLTGRSRFKTMEASTHDQEVDIDIPESFQLGYYEPLEVNS